mmetsp:Transcript_115241/g.321123  ORF Transcript_115241/g.321123 Transcript_115241/m.321123 type:complete len:277 (-) Transcript_115241:207-1037(-)
MPSAPGARPSMAARSSAAVHSGPPATAAASTSWINSDWDEGSPLVHRPLARKMVPSNAKAAAASRAPQFMPSSRTPLLPPSRTLRSTSVRLSRKSRSNGRGWAEGLSRRCTAKLSAALPHSRPTAPKASRQDAAICRGSPRSTARCCPTSAARSKPPGAPGSPADSRPLTSSCSTSASTSAARAARANSCWPKCALTVSGISSSAITCTPARNSWSSAGFAGVLNILEPALATTGGFAASSRIDAMRHSMRSAPADTFAAHSDIARMWSEDSSTLR